MKKFVADVELDENGDHILNLPDEFLKEVGWKVGDVIKWTDNKDGTFSINKVEEEMEWVLVETVLSYRMRYMVQVPKGKSEWALDNVTCETAKEFSQKPIGEQIVSHRVLTEDQAIELCDVDNDYCSSWSRERKIEVFFTKDGEKVEL